MNLVDNLLKKDKINMINNLYIDILHEKYNDLPRNPCKIFNISEVDSFPEKQKLLYLFFTHDANKYKLNINLNEITGSTNLVFMWIYYKIYGFDQTIETVVNDNNTKKSIFLYDDIIMSLKKKSIDNEKHTIEIIDDPEHVIIDHQIVSIFKSFDYEMTLDQIDMIYKHMLSNSDYFYGNIKK